MSSYTQQFFKKHEEWLDRNEEYLENSSWHFQPLPPAKKKFLEDGTEDLEDKGLVKRYASHTKRKENAIISDRSIIKGITGRLAHFVKKTKDEKHLESNKVVVKRFLDIINIFLSNCDTYLRTHKLIDIDDSKLRNIEIKFQDIVFNYKIEFEDQLESLGVYDETSEAKVKFYKDDMASLVLREPLILLNDDVKIQDEKVPVDWNIQNSTEMYINMNPKDIPRWNYKKHYFDQEKSTIEFWQEEFNKIKNGFTVGGYFIHPWLYFHLNYFRTPIPQIDGSEPTIQPSLRDNEWFFAENLKACISEENPNFYNKAMLVYGTRRFAKSVIMASLAHWRTLVKFNSTGTIVGGSSGDLGSLTSKVKTSMMYIERAFKLDMMKQNWENGETTFGIKEDISNAVIYSTLLVQNLQDGAKKSTQKTAGLAPSVSIYDEIGKYAFLKPYLAALPSFKTPYGFKCITVLAGTGGEADLSMDAMEVLNNPEAYDLLPMNYDLLESKLDPEWITWKRRKFATFFPGQMAYEEGFIKEPKKFGEFLGIKNKTLDDITINLTNWPKNQAYLEAKIDEAKKMKSSKGNLLEQQRKVQYPMDPEDCFITLEGNPFPAAEIKAHKEYIINEGLQGRKVFLVENAQGGIEEVPAEDSPLPDFPFQGGFIESPVVLHESLPDTKPPFGLYIIGLDDYKHEQSDGDSVGSFVVYKRQWVGEWSLRVVATYTSRPNPQRNFHRQGFYLAKAFNALVFPENEDMNFKTFLDKRHVTDTYLMKGLDFAAALNLNNNGNRAYGWNPTSKNISYGMGLLVNYATEDLDIKDANGNVVKTILGLKRINDVGILEEMQHYSAEGNFDRLRGFMSALMYAHYLDTIFMTPKLPSAKQKEERATVKKRKRANPYGTRRGKPYRR